VKDLIIARIVSSNVNDVMKTAEEKVNSVSKEEWTAQCMHRKETEEYRNWNWKLVKCLNIS
jgi:hypothetical protein